MADARRAAPATLSPLEREDAARVLAAGDALLFGGDTLHRTHVMSSMTALRTSVELRLFAAGEPPARLAGDRFFAC